MNGYTKIPNELLRNAMLTPTEKTAWGVIASMADGYVPTIATYCSMVRCHFNTWRAVIKRLRSYGMVTVEHSGNMVRYFAVTDPRKWTYPNKICKGNKICDPNNNCEGEGNNNCEGDPNKICDPLEEQKKNKENNLHEAHVRAREESIILRLKIYDQWSEAICMKNHIDPTRWSETVDAFVLDMRCANKNLTEINDIRAYFNGWIINHNNEQRTNQGTGYNGDSRDKLDRDAIKAMAALAAQSRQPVEPTW